MKRRILPVMAKIMVIAACMCFITSCGGSKLSGTYVPENPNDSNIYFSSMEFDGDTVHLQIGTSNVGFPYKISNGTFSIEANANLSIDGITAPKSLEYTAEKDGTFTLGGVHYIKEEDADYDYDDVEILEMDQDNPEQLYGVAQTYMTGGLPGSGFEQDYDKAFEYMEKAANLGYAEAQNALGGMYANGTGVAQDDKKAAEWLTKAAEQGNAYAQFNLAMMYYRGRGVELNKEKAMELLKKAADQDIVDAQENLGIIYGMDMDYENAVYWLTKAAENGAVKSQLALGQTYMYGVGVEQSNEQAEKWLTMAAEQGSSEAKQLLNELHSK